MIPHIKDTLLLVGDIFSSRKDFRDMFKENYNILEAENVSQAIMFLKQNRDCIILVLIDLPCLKKEDLNSLMASASSESETDIPIVIILDKNNQSEWEEQAFLLGAVDVILKPFSHIAVQHRIQVLIDLFAHKWDLNKMVANQNESIRASNQAMLDALSTIIEHRSTEAGNHVLRIRKFTQILLEEVAVSCPEYNLTPDSIDIIVSASALHDIGKISIPDAILNKPEKLTSDEFEIMKTHSVIGAQMIQSLFDLGGDKSYLTYAYNIALYHHERWDGRGYPKGLCGDDIPICAQTVGLTDVFDALTTERVYKPAYSCQEAINMILNGKCGLFSPKLLECFKHVYKQFIDLASKYADGYSPKNEQLQTIFPSPILGNNNENALSLLQTKYQSLLHHINSTVLELDLDNQIYQIVYNPNYDVDPLIPNTSFDQIITHLRNANIHPDDISTVDTIINFINHEFFDRGLRRYSFNLRIFNSQLNDYQVYEMTFLNASNDIKHRLLTVLWYKAPSIPFAAFSVGTEKRGASPQKELTGLINSVLCCYNDKFYAIKDGASTLSPLVGYSAEEIVQQFNGEFASLILEEDRGVAVAAITTALSIGNSFEIEFRLVRKNQSPLWIIAKGLLRLGNDGNEFLYFNIYDNSRNKAVIEKLNSDLSVSQMLLDQSGSVVFDWDVVTDTMYYSPSWAKCFGYIPVSNNYSTHLGTATHFHPDDLPVIRSTIENLKNGEDSATAEIRLANSEGRYLWLRMVATAYRDNQNKLVRIVGIMQDIDEFKQITTQLTERAERDTLTGLLRKSSGQTLIKNYLSSRKSAEMAALLLIDLDNFKNINDRLGHLYGDDILTQIGSTLRRLFRSNDIITRVGGDEFLVFMCNIPSEELLELRCEHLRNSLTSLLEKNAPGLQVSCSIGVSVAPIHGTTYNSLFSRADQALYHIKGSGKNNYKIFRNGDKYFSPASGVSRTTIIDSDDPNIVTTESFERFVFSCLYESSNLDETINELLAFVGRSFNVSRAYIFENNDDNTACSNTYEWCNEGIQPEKDNLQNISYITDIPGWPDIYNENNLVYCTDISQLAPQFRAILEPQGIKSMLHHAIIDQGVFRGYIGFDECNSNRLWTHNQISHLKFLAESISVFLMRDRNSKR